MLFLTFLWFTTVACGLSNAVDKRVTPHGFHPKSYHKTFVKCPAVDRSHKPHKHIDLKLGYLDINPDAKETIVMLHGWPSLWTTYRNQFATLGSKYRLIVPEHRGYGDSEHPKDLYSSNTMPDFVNDVMCIMDHAGVSAGVCLGNDFGAQVCWEAGRMRPDRFIGVFNIAIPYVSSDGPFTSNEQLAAIAPGVGYTVYLSKNATGGAKEMDADVQNAIRSCAQVNTTDVPDNFLKDQDSFLNSWYEDNKAHHRKNIPFSGIMSKEVEDYMVESYKKQGFFNTFNGYQNSNRRQTYDFEQAQGNFTLTQPTFSLWPKKDPVADWEELAKKLKSSNYLTNHFNATLPTAHWPHEEDPEATDAIFLEWIGNVTFPKKHAC